MEYLEHGLLLIVIDALQILVCLGMMRWMVNGRLLSLVSSTYISDTNEHYINKMIRYIQLSYTQVFLMLCITKTLQRTLNAKMPQDVESGNNQW